MTNLQEPLLVQSWFDPNGPRHAVADAILVTPRLHERLDDALRLLRSSGRPHPHPDLFTARRLALAVAWHIARPITTRRTAEPTDRTLETVFERFPVERIVRLAWVVAAESRSIASESGDEPLDAALRPACVAALADSAVGPEDGEAWTRFVERYLDRDPTRPRDHFAARRELSTWLSATRRVIALEQRGREKRAREQLQQDIPAQQAAGRRDEIDEGIGRAWAKVLPCCGDAVRGSNPRGWLYLYLARKGYKLDEIARMATAPEGAHVPKAQAVSDGVKLAMRAFRNQIAVHRGTQDMVEGWMGGEYRTEQLGDPGYRLPNVVRQQYERERTGGAEWSEDSLEHPKTLERRSRPFRAILQGGAILRLRASLLNERLVTIAFEECS